MAGASSRNDDAIVGINVTPLVDITLVLLIIFMVTAKLIAGQSVPLDLPSVLATARDQRGPVVAWPETEGMDAMFVHDSSAVAYLLDPSLFTVRRGPVRVVCDGIATGQTIQKPDRKKNTPPAWHGRPSQTICIGVNAQRLLDLYYKTVTGA